ncbi:MAG: NnrS family protein, partial [Gammaproteobacteria bacterium]|nr:NnrS family protein [Gammaproteobacteria bacterium]
SLARHALTVGGIGVVTLGMMARVSLGHTGRPLEPARWVAASFLVLNLAAVLRVFGPLLAPERYALWVELSAGLWVLTFLAFLAHYAPILVRPRPDGQPG